ncbi:PHP domain-containing protein [Bradyrhizobium tunisiense]|uniref:PHP domain-containing protein n=1 Tax=Bradyrhizobium tunisiense TaxID=3278709 RepID=UPI0035DD5467
MFNGRIDSPDPQLAALAKHSSVSGLAHALQRPAGARFYRCALQVNPYEYTIRHAKKSAYSSELEYNAAIVDACLKHDVKVVGITDHFRVDTSAGLAQALKKAGIQVFVGFEASSSEGVHILCLFPGTMSVQDLERAIGKCGVVDQQSQSPQSDKTCEQLLQEIPKMGGIAVAAHASSANGVLTTLKGQTRMRVWCSRDLLAIAVAGARDQVPEEHRQIVANKDSAHKRERSIAVINANDVSAPEALAETPEQETLSPDGVRDPIA